MADADATAATDLAELIAYMTTEDATSKLTSDDRKV